MRPEIVAADRRLEVRRGATRWRKAGVFDAATETVIAARFADDRVRTTRLFRVLFFGFTWFGWSSAYGLGTAFFFGLVGRSVTGIPFALLNVFAGLVALAAAEWLHTVRRLRRFGVEEAIVWIGLSELAGGVLWLLHASDALPDRGLVGLGGWLVASGATLAAWRWGTPGTGAAAGCGLFLALAQAPAAHVLWLVVAVLLVGAGLALATDPERSPAARSRFREAFVVATVAFYFAVHEVVVEERVFRWLVAGTGWGASRPEVEVVLLLAAKVAMLVFPLALLAVGASRRFRPALDLGALLLVATIAWWVGEARPRPAWLVLLVAGGAGIALALALRRFLAARADGEWRGLTAAPLAEDRSLAAGAETFAVLTTLSPSARTAAPVEDAGGSFGGGGASARF